MCTRTSLTSGRASIMAFRIRVSTRWASRIVKSGETSAVKSTNIRLPDLMALTFRIPKIAWEAVFGYDEVDVDLAGGVIRGWTILERACRVLGVTPASERSRIASRSNAKPCWKIRMDMRVPRRVESLADSLSAYDLEPTSNSIQRQSWDGPAAQDSNKCHGT